MERLLNAKKENIVKQKQIDNTTGNLLSLQRVIGNSALLNTDNFQVIQRQPVLPPLTNTRRGTQHGQTSQTHPDRAPQQTPLPLLNTPANRAATEREHNARELAIQPPVPLTVHSNIDANTPPWRSHAINHELAVRAMIPHAANQRPDLNADRSSRIRYRLARAHENRMGVNRASGTLNDILGVSEAAEYWHGGMCNEYSSLLFREYMQDSTPPPIVRFWDTDIGHSFIEVGDPRVDQLVIPDAWTMLRDPVLASDSIQSFDRLQRRQSWAPRMPDEGSQLLQDYSARNVLRDNPLTQRQILEAIDLGNSDLADIYSRHPHFHTYLHPTNDDTVLTLFNQSTSAGLDDIFNQFMPMATQQRGY